MKYLNKGNNSSKKALNIIRWILFLPLALLGSWIVMRLAHTWGKMILGFNFFGSESLLGQYFLNTAPYVGMGASYIIIGTFITPNNRRLTLLLLGILGLVISGFLLYPITMTNNWWRIWNMIATIIGISVSAFYLYPIIRIHDANEYFFRGISKSEMKDYSAAINDLDKAIELNPNDVTILPSVLHCRGIAKAGIGDYRGAIEDYDKAIELDPNFAVCIKSRKIAKAALEQKESGCLDLSKDAEKWLS